MPENLTVNDITAFEQTKFPIPRHASEAQFCVWFQIDSESLFNPTTLLILLKPLLEVVQHLSASYKGRGNVFPHPKHPVIFPGWL